MLKYDIYTDSSADLPEEVVQKYDIQVMQLEVTIDDNEPVWNKDVDITDFYNQLRNGANAKTSAVTLGYFKEHMRESLAEGKDVLYLGFSSGLSATYNNGVMMMEELKEEFPERKLFYMDTLCASAGQGLLVYHAARLREQGEDLETVFDKIAGMKDYVHHQVTVDDLLFLKRGGRLDATSAVVGTVLKVKPLIVMDKEGHLQNVAKTRGRKNALKEMYAKFTETQNLSETGCVFISHANCLEDAKALETMVQTDFPLAEVVICDIGPVIGAHTGPGGLALCYMGKVVKGN